MSVSACELEGTSILASRNTVLDGSPNPPLEGTLLREGRV